VHVDDIELVIHVDPPAEHKAYLHRSGRTARAGKEGEVVTLVLPEQRKDTAQLLRKAAITVTPQRVTADSPAVTALVGEVAEYVKPLPRAAEPVRGQSQGGRSQGANAQRKRAGREGGADSAPRRDRNGRPAAAGAPAAGGRAGGGARRGGATGGRPAAAASAPRTYSTSTGGNSGYAAESTGGARRQGRRAQG
jgi:superfamily II DNA/RNA helicase